MKSIAGQYGKKPGQVAITAEEWKVKYFYQAKFIDLNMVTTKEESRCRT